MELKSYTKHHVTDLDRATYNPGRVAVGQLTSRPLVTGSENSSISEMTTGSIGNTREREIQINS